MEAYHILIVEDDKEILDGVGIYMKNQGYEVFKAQNGLEGLKILEKEEIHLAIIDIMMPVMDGITMTMKLREHYDFPVIMLSAKSEEIDKVTGLNIGADDYVTKPFAPMELMARVNSQLRRYSRYLKLAAGSRTEEAKEHFYAVGGLELNEDTVEVSVDGNPVTLTPLEFKILALLMRNPGRVFSHGDHHGAYPEYPDEDRSQSEKSKIFEGGMGCWIQNRKTVKNGWAICSVFWW